MENKGIVRTTLGILNKEGPLAFYKGLGGPLASVPALNAIVFCSYETSRKYFEATGNTGYLHSINLLLIQFLFQEPLLGS